MMSGKEKLYFLLNRIDDAREITPSDQPVLISPLENLSNSYSIVELNQLLAKLEKDEKVLRVLKTTELTEVGGVLHLDPYEEDIDDGYFHLEILPAFNAYFAKIKNEPEYQEFTGKNPPTPQIQNKALQKLDRKELEYIWNLFLEIEGSREFGGDAKEHVHVPQYPYDNKGENYNDFYNIRKSCLQNLLHLGAITDLKEDTSRTLSFWAFRLGDNYQKVFKDYQNQYKEIAEDYPQSEQTEEIKIKDIAYEVKYSEKSREILINNFLLAKPDFNSENEIVFSCLYRNTNRTVPTKELEQQVGDKFKKPIHNILRDLGFTGSLARVFFGASKNGVVFRNPITYQDLKDLGIERIKIQEKK